MVCYLDLSGNDLGDQGIQCISSNLPLSHITSLSLCKVDSSRALPPFLVPARRNCCGQVGMKDDAAALLANAIPKSSLVSLLVRSCRETCNLQLRHAINSRLCGAPLPAASFASKRWRRH
jgi:hypothetical protein